MHKDRVGFIGLGRMGLPMARRIHAAGFPLMVYDVAEQPLDHFRSKGVATGRSPQEIADNAEIVFSCLPSAEASLAVALGNDGVALGEAIQVYIEASTIGPNYMTQIWEGLGSTRIALLDAPISGGIPGAEAGTLSVVAAGASDALERVRPVLTTFSRNVFVVADRPGQAQIARLVNNMLSISGTIAAFEGMTMAQKAGLDLATLFDFINVSTGRNVATMQKIPNKVLTGEFGGRISTPLKDISFFLEQAERLGVRPFISKTAREVLQEASAWGCEETMRLGEFLNAMSADPVSKSSG